MILVDEMKSFRSHYFGLDNKQTVSHPVLPSECKKGNERNCKEKAITTFACEIKWY